jgi:hypothetical protein
MKKYFLPIFLIVTVALSGCGKDVSIFSSPRVVAGGLTNYGTRTWRLKALFINNAAQVLTPAQTLYTKTYKNDYTWKDSDGYNGTFTVPNTKEIQEVTTNAQGGPLTITYTIVDFTSAELTVEYSYNQATYKFVYGE